MIAQNCFKLFGISLLLALSTSALAQESDVVEKDAYHYIVQGGYAFVNEDYESAISNYEQSLAKDDTPVIRRNLAIAHWMNRDYPTSLEHFRSFRETIDETDTNSDLIEKTEFIIVELEKKAAVHWVYRALIRWRPPGRQTYIPRAKETAEESKDRYESIARDLAEVVYNPDSEPLFKGSHGRTNSAKIVMGVAFNESGFRRDVDFGDGEYARGDHGKSWCFMQLNIGKGTTQEGWTGPELVADRIKCFTAGLNAIRRSFKACYKYEMLDRLAGYTVGSCRENQHESRVRMGTSIKLMSHYKIPMRDKNLQEIFWPPKPIEDPSPEIIDEDLDGIPPVNDDPVENSSENPSDSKLAGNS